MIDHIISRFLIRSNQLTRFLLVGGIAVLFDATGYATMVKFLGIESGTSKRLSFILGSVWAFFANRRFTFTSSAPVKREIFLFSMLYMSTYFANGWIHDVTLRFSAINWLSFIMATGTSTCINFLGQKFVVFRKSQ